MLNKLKMNVVQTADNGIVNHETIFHFEQKESQVWAHYSGGKIEKGYLVGTLEDELLSFTYCQLRKSGEMDHGESKCNVTREKSGKVKLEERFAMSTKNSKELGTNIFMEI